MRIIPTLVLVAGLCVSADSFAQDAPFRNIADEADPQVIAFIGKKIFVEERNLKTTMMIEDGSGNLVERVMPNFDSRYEARYRILDWIVEPESPRPEIDFTAYDHYSNPRFPKVETPLLFLEKHDGQWFHSKYLFYDVSKTTDGDWAICGSPDRYKDNGDEGLDFVEPLSFLKPDIEKPCISGTRAKRIFDYQNVTRFLPDQWHRACNLQLGYPTNTLIGTGSHPTAKEEKDAARYKVCIDKKRFEAFR